MQSFSFLHINVSLVSVFNFSVPDATGGKFENLDAKAPDDTTSKTDKQSTPQSQAWFMNYVVPWHLFSKTFTKACEEGKHPEKTDMNEMVRVLMNDIRFVCRPCKPKRSELKHVVTTIITKYPALRASINGTTLHDGTSTLLAKLEARRENMDRSLSSTPKQKTKSTDDSTAAKKKRLEKNEYGCIVSRVNPPLPEGQTLNTQKEKQKQLENMYSEEWNEDEIDEEMMATYSSQRKMISEGEPVPDVLNAWPFLGEERWLIKHFQHLTGVTISSESVAQKAIQFYTFLVAQPKQSNAMKDIFSSIEKSMTESKNKKSVTNALLPLLTTYFKEETDSILRCYKVRANLCYSCL